MNAYGNQNEIQALVSMVDDPDPAIYHEIYDKIVQHGEDALPFLEDELVRVAGEKSRARLESLIRKIHVGKIGKGLEDWIYSPTKDDLIEAWLWVSRYRYPDLCASRIRDELESIRRDVWLEMNDNLTALERIKVLNHVFYDILGFGGNMDDYHNTDNSYLNRVLETRKGNPLSLSIIYMSLAREMNMPVVGINLPEHFVLAFMGETVDPDSLQVRYDKPLFYINAFSGGAVFSEMEINAFLQKLKFDPLPSFFEPCPYPRIILRMLNNLVMAYELQGDDRRKEELASLRDRFERLLV